MSITPKMKPLGLIKHIFCYITLGLLCGWYYFLIILVPILLFLACLGSYIAGAILSTLIVLAVIPLNHEPKTSFMYSWIFQYWTEYFEMTVDNDSIKDKFTNNSGKKFMFLEFPHGIFPLGSFLSVYFMREICGPNDMICGIGADAVFMFPITRQIFAWIGTQPAKRSNITKILKSGHHCAILPGGIAGKLQYILRMITYCMNMHHCMRQIYTQ